MPQNTPFSRIVIEPAANGYIIEVETADFEEKLVFSSLRLTLRELKKLLKVEDDSE